MGPINSELMLNELSMCSSLMINHWLNGLTWLISHHSEWIDAPLNAGCFTDNSWSLTVDPAVPMCPSFDSLSCSGRLWTVQSLPAQLNKSVNRMPRTTESLLTFTPSKSDCFWHSLPFLFFRIGITPNKNITYDWSSKWLMLLKATTTGMEKVYEFS